MTEWAKTLPADGNARMGHYPFEKLTCGLADLGIFAGSTEAFALLEKVITYAQRHVQPRQRPGRRSPRQLCRLSRRMVHACRESLPRVYGYQQYQVQRLRRHVALRRLLE